MSNLRPQHNPVTSVSYPNHLPRAYCLHYILVAFPTWYQMHTSKIAAGNQNNASYDSPNGDVGELLHSDQWIKFGWHSTQGVIHSKNRSAEYGCLNRCNCQTMDLVIKRNRSHLRWIRFDSGIGNWGVGWVHYDKAPPPCYFLMSETSRHVGLFTFTRNQFAPCSIGLERWRLGKYSVQFEIPRHFDQLQCVSKTLHNMDKYKRARSVGLEGLPICSSTKSKRGKKQQSG